MIQTELLLLPIVHYESTSAVTKHTSSITHDRREETRGGGGVRSGTAAEVSKFLVNKSRSPSCLEGSPLYPGSEQASNVCLGKSAVAQNPAVAVSSIETIHHTNHFFAMNIAALTPCSSHG
jgi:hypothetical protein